MATRLLIAEDTRDLNRALVAVLQHDGYEVVSAFDGQEALDLLDEGGYDGVVLDIMMPRKSGLQVLSAMRASGDYTPVLLLTAKTEVEDRVTGLDAGADDYLAKPFAMQELLARIRSMTRRRDEYVTRRLVFEDITLDAQTLELASSNAVRLSVKEFELLQELVTNASRWLSVERLLAKVWRQEREEGAGEDTLRLYVSYLRGKLKWIGSSVTIREAEDGFRLVTSEGDR